MYKRFISLLLTVALFCSIVLVPGTASAADGNLAEISNPYIRVTVNKDNGGYVIATKEGDILNKSDDNVDLTHRGANMDSSFTSFQIGEGAGKKDYIFGNDYGFLGLNSTPVKTTVNQEQGWIKSTWSVENMEVEQNITLINSDQSEQLGTALITYTVQNKGSASIPVKGRILMDTQMGDQDYGYYELPKQYLGQGYEYFDYERSWDSNNLDKNPMPADYFVRDQLNQSKIVGYGVNSVFEDQKPYKMTFAHWANIAASKFDYKPDETLHFTNDVNVHRTADSAVALYYDLKTIPAGGKASFATHYGVTANLKNKNNQILINTTAPSRMEFKDESRTAYKSSDPSLADNQVRINVTLSNPRDSKKTYKQIRAVIYAMGFETQRQDDRGEWTNYNNIDPLYTDVFDLKPGQSEVTYFDFQFKPKNEAQLGSFVIKVFDMDSSDNQASGVYGEEFGLGSTENFIILPGQARDLPAITLTAMEPEIVYNDETRYVTVHGKGVEFFRSDLLNKVTFEGKNGKSYDLTPDVIKNIIYEQPEDQNAQPTTATFQLRDYMEPGDYQMHFHWKTNTGEPALQNVPQDFTSSAMKITMSSDTQYKNDHYGVIAVVRDGEKKYKAMPFHSEKQFESAKLNPNDVLITVRGELQEDKSIFGQFRLASNDQNVTINHVLNYYGSDFTLISKNGTVEILMDGHITSVGANSTIRDGTASLRLKSGTEYLVPLYNERGEVQENGALNYSGQEFICLKWDNAFDVFNTIGGFLIDLKYGMLGKIKYDDGEIADVMSFGGSLDLSFMTPGGAKNTRINNVSKREGWVCVDPNKGSTQHKAGDDGEGIKEEHSISGYAHINDVLYGGKNPDYMGINMETKVHLPRFASFLPKDFGKLDLGLGINTIGGYQVGVEGELELGKMEGEVRLVIKSKNGRPIPDEMFFAIAGFEPGFNVDGHGIFWVTGGGGGVKDLYDTIYAKDGLPPVTLLLRVNFNIVKILAGKADLELSLHGISISMDDVKLRKLENVKFLDEGKVALQWYPNFGFELEGSVNLLSVMKGKFYIHAAAGKTVDDFVEMMMRVGLIIPKVIPIVGGMELAALELGGGSEKMWGSAILLDTIKIGFIYYWGGDVKFVAGDQDGGQTLSTLSNDRSAQLFSDITEPHITNRGEGEVNQYMAVGTNLDFAAGSSVVSNLDSMINKSKNPKPELMDTILPPSTTGVFTNEGRTQHLINIADSNDYIITVSRSDGSALTSAGLKNVMNMSQGKNAYSLKYYSAPSGNASDKEKEELLKTCNVNVTGNAAYILIPKKDLEQGQSFLIEFNDGKEYDVGAVRVNPVSELTSASANISGDLLNVKWDGTHLSDTAQIVVSVSDKADGDGGAIIGTAAAKDKTSSFAIPENMASGNYYVTVALSDEDLTYQVIKIEKPITVKDVKSPDAIKDVVVTNNGNYKLKVKVTPPENMKNLSGYMVDVYENIEGIPNLVHAGLYFDKDSDIIIGGQYSYAEPVVNENGEPVLNEDGSPKMKDAVVKEMYTPGASYSVGVRAVNLEDPDPLVSDDEIFHYSPVVNSESIILNEPQIPKVELTYDVKTGEAKITSDINITGELYVNGNTAEGTWYDYKEAFVSKEQKLDLPDGDHLLELHAIGPKGDQIMVQEIISVDTKAPTMLIASPVSGGTFDGTNIPVILEASEPAVYEATLNGEKVQVSTVSEAKSGQVELSISIPEVLQKSANLEVVLTSKDKAGLTTTQKLKLVNRKLSEVREIQLCRGYTPIENGTLNLKQGESASLKVMGILADGSKIDVTNNGNVDIFVQTGKSSILKDNMLIAKEDGKATLQASFDLGSGYSKLEDMVNINVGELLDSNCIINASTTNAVIKNIPLGTSYCFVAVYTPNGKMFTSATDAVTGNNLTVNFNQEVPVGCEVKLFALDSNYVPVKPVKTTIVLG